MVSFAESTWALLPDLDGVWTQIFTGGPNTDLDTIPTVSFAAGTLDGIRFVAPETAGFSGLTGAIFTFDQTMPEPGGLPLFMTALGALTIGIRIRGPQRRLTTGVAAIRAVPRSAVPTVSWPALPAPAAAMPLIRYAIGDHAEAGVPCGCGRTLGTLARILGRSSTGFTAVGGATLSYNPAGTFARYVDILEYQIVQRSPVLVELLLVVRKPLGSAAEAALAAALTAVFGHAFPLRFTYVESIPRGTDGKLHDIQCEVPEAD
jgi:hypothetical protein